MGIPVRDLTFGGRGRAEHAPYPQMLTPGPRRFLETRDIIFYYLGISYPTLVYWTLIFMIFP